MPPSGHTEIKKGELVIIGAGLGRTGTASLKTALELVGLGPAHHMVEVFKRHQYDLWLDAIAGKPKWDVIYEEYVSAVDFPTCCFYRELMEKYPNAKIILTVRSADAWYKSVSDTIFNLEIHGIPLSMRMYNNVFPSARKSWRFKRLLLERQFGPRAIFKDPEALKRKYLEHNEEVKNFVPSDRLLVFDVKEGWKPLCDFLKIPVPNMPFPHVNDTEAFQKRMKDWHKYANRCFYGGLAGTLVLGAAIFAAWKYDLIPRLPQRK